MVCGSVVVAHKFGGKDCHIGGLLGGRRNDFN